MKTLYALLLAAAGVPPAASAQPPAYHSAFTGYQRTPDTMQSPDQAWRQANREVAGSGHAMAHMGHGAMPPGAASQHPAAHGNASHMGHDAPARPDTRPETKPETKPGTPQHDHKDH